MIFIIDNIFFKLFIDNAGIGLGITDIDGKILYLNKTLCQLAEVESFESLRDQDVTKYNFIFENESERKKIFNEIKKNGSWTGELPIKTKSGKIIPTIQNLIILRDPLTLKALYFANAITLITEQKRIETELNKELEKLAETLSSIDNGVITYDNSGTILFMNAAAQLITGYDAKESIGKLVEKIIFLYEEDTHKRLFQSTKEIFPPISSEKKSNLTQSLILVTKDGEEKNIAFSISPLLNSKHEIIGSVLIFRDTTQQRRLELELFKKQKLESIGILAGGIAHDFNNLLTSIIGNLSILKMDLQLESNSAITRILNETEASIQRARDLTKQLLTFSKGGAPVKNLEDISSIIKDTTDFILRGTSTQVEYHISTDLWTSNFDKSQIGQVIQNLVLNASQSMNNKGIIKIHADNYIIQSDNVFSLKPGNYIRVVVEDNGVGIPEQNLNKIFDLYFTTKPSGAGFGLSICNSIITRHGGAITVESKLNIGSKFIFFLPANPDATKKTEEKIEKIALKGGRILVLEDEEPVAHVLKSMLTRLNFEVEITSDGVETIDKYKQFLQEDRPFDVVVLDLTIQKGMDGAETMKKLLQIDPDVKALISSGYVSNEILSNYEKYGFKEYLEKPFTVTELANKLNKIMKK